MIESSSGSKRSLRLVGCLVLCLCLSLAYAAGFAAHQLWERQRALAYQPQVDELYPQMHVFWEAWAHVENSFYGELPPASERTYGAIRETLLLLDDPYTVFVEPQPRELERDQMRGVFGGIGVDLWRDAENRLVLSPYPDSPAEHAGVLPGDILLAMDNVPVTSDTTVDDARAYLHGEVGTSVTLTLSRFKDGSPTPPFDLTITREEILVPTVVWRVLDQAPSVGYIRVQGFTDRTDEETIEALQELMNKSKVASLVLDLRDNFGGLLDPAVTVASQFLNEGVVMYEQRKNAEESARQVRPGGIATDVPLVVLINGNTASASEIVAGALQDHERASLLGERTFGKGSVQLIYDLSDGSSLHVTSAIWLTPNHHRIEGTGLTPDVLVPPGSGPRDVQLDYAVEHLLQSGVDE
jgi:carboxyl-terminal processing protease